MRHLLGDVRLNDDAVRSAEAGQRTTLPGRIGGGGVTESGSHDRRDAHGRRRIARGHSRNVRIVQANIAAYRIEQRSGAGVGIDRVTRLLMLSENFWLTASSCFVAGGSSAREFRRWIRRYVVLQSQSREWRLGHRVYRAFRHIAGDEHDAAGADLRLARREFHRRMRESRTKCTIPGPGSNFDIQETLTRSRSLPRTAISVSMVRANGSKAIGVVSSITKLPIPSLCSAFATNVPRARALIGVGDRLRQMLRIEGAVDLPHRWRHAD